MIKQRELDMMRKNPVPEVRRRIRKALEGSVEIKNCNIEGVIFNGWHGIRGVINNSGKYLLEFKISKKVV